MTDNSNGPPGPLAAAGEADLADHRAPSPSLPVNGDSKTGPLSFVNRPGNNIHTLSVSRSPSNGPSPRSSRDSSPAGRAFRQQGAGATAQGMRSRKDSHDASPHRPPSIPGHTTTIPSAASIQRALSTTAALQLQPTTVSETTSKLPQRSHRASVGASGDSTPSWPISPRLKSPPPSGSRRESLRSQRKPEIPPLAPSIVLRPSSSSDSLSLAGEAQPEPEPQTATSAKATNRGASGAPTLATVEETSNPVTPSNGIEVGPT
jgi:hypothetical protein